MTVLANDTNVTSAKPHYQSPLSEPHFQSPTFRAPLSEPHFQSEALTRYDATSS
jgi:hypothetical protein